MRANIYTHVCTDKTHIHKRHAHTHLDTRTMCANTQHAHQACTHKYLHTHRECAYLQLWRGTHPLAPPLTHSHPLAHNLPHLLVLLHTPTCSLFFTHCTPAHMLTLTTALPHPPTGVHTHAHTRTLLHIHPHALTQSSHPHACASTPHPHTQPLYTHSPAHTHTTTPTHTHTQHTHPCLPPHTPTQGLGALVRGGLTSDCQLRCDLGVWCTQRPCLCSGTVHPVARSPAMAWLPLYRLPPAGSLARWPLPEARGLPGGTWWTQVGPGAGQPPQKRTCPWLSLQGRGSPPITSLSPVSLPHRPC